MRKTISIAAGDLRAEIVPSLGGGLLASTCWAIDLQYRSFGLGPKVAVMIRTSFHHMSLFPGQIAFQAGIPMRGPLSSARSELPGRAFSTARKWLDIGMDSIWTHNGPGIACLRFGWSRFLPL